NGGFGAEGGSDAHIYIPTKLVSGPNMPLQYGQAKRGFPRNHTEYTPKYGTDGAWGNPWTSEAVSWGSHRVGLNDYLSNVFIKGRMVFTPSFSDGAVGAWIFG